MKRRKIDGREARRAGLVSPHSIPRWRDLQRQARRRRHRRALTCREIQHVEILTWGLEDFPIVESPNGAKVQKVRLREMAEALLCGEQDLASEIRAD